MNPKIFFSSLVSLITILLVVLLTDPAIQKNAVNLFGINPDFARVVQPSKDPSKIESARVRRVIDGDTIQLEDGRSIRYLYVDTPETVHPTKPVMCFGVEAKQANIALIEGKEVQLVQDKDPTDRYGRDLRLVFLPSRDASDPSQSINAELVKGGFAKAVSYSPNTTYQETFVALQRESKQANLGAWKSCPKPFEE